MNYEMNRSMRNLGIGATALFTVACSQMPVSSNATPEEAECHRVAGGGDWKRTAIDTGVGAAAGALGGLMLGNTGTGAGVGAVGGALYGENRYRRAYDECMRRFNQNSGQGGAVVPGVKPSNVPAYTAPSGTYQQKRVPVPAPGR